MAISASLKEMLSETLAPVGAISFKRMFGGAGVYADRQIFAIIIADVIYFKSDATTEARFKAEGSEPFSYETKQGTRAAMTYWRLPERLLDEPDEMVVWARRALGVARVAAAAKESAAAKTNKARGPKR